MIDPLKFLNNRSSDVTLSRKYHATNNEHDRQIWKASAAHLDSQETFYGHAYPASLIIIKKHTNTVW